MNFKRNGLLSEIMFQNYFKTTVITFKKFEKIIKCQKQL